MKEIYQRKLHKVIADLMAIDTANPDFELYKNTIALVYSLIEDGKLKGLDMALRQNFPGYYTTPIPIVTFDN